MRFKYRALSQPVALLITDPLLPQSFLQGALPSCMKPLPERQAPHLPTLHAGQLAPGVSLSCSLHWIPWETAISW